MRDEPERRFRSAAGELTRIIVSKSIHSVRTSISRRSRNEATDIGLSVTGYADPSDGSLFYSKLDWMDRQLVKEWRTCSVGSRRKLPSRERGGGDPSFSSSSSCSSSTSTSASASSSSSPAHGAAGVASAPASVAPEGSGERPSLCGDQNCDFDTLPDHAQVRRTIPSALPKPPFARSIHCLACGVVFSATLFRHHCRGCGQSFCESHVAHKKTLPQYGYPVDVEERVCEECHSKIDAREWNERVQWRNSRVSLRLVRSLVLRSILRPVRRASFSHHSTTFHFPPLAAARLAAPQGSGLSAKRLGSLFQHGNGHGREDRDKNS